MNDFTVKIHEFSTGINVHQRADGKWISGGFTGEWMNSTLASIPTAVQRAIANKEFAVTESAYREKPAVIGRVVLGSDVGQDLSVVAVVSKFEDDRGRSFSAYRYFLCKEPNSLGIILAWMENYRQEHGHLPVLNPDETKRIGQANVYNSIYTPNSSLSDDFQDWVKTHPDTTIIMPKNESYDFQMINSAATIKAATVNQPISWAYNVEAISRAEKFLIIQAASLEAFDRITRSRDAQINKTAALSPAVDENEIETAVRGLINGSQVRAKNIETIIANLDPNKVGAGIAPPLPNWEQIFDGLGATNALNSGSSGAGIAPPLPNMVRLLTLRAIVIPETLPEFLDWVKIERNVNPEDAKRTTSVQFQSQLMDYFPDLKPNIALAIKIVLAKLVETRKTVPQVPGEAFAWLLTVSNGLWALYRSEMIEDIIVDLETIKTLYQTARSKTSTRNFQCGQAIWKPLQSKWKPRLKYKLTNYQTLGDLFSRLGEHDLAAYFCQVSNGQVPKEIFTRAYGNRIWEVTNYGLKVTRETTLVEKIVWGVRSNSVLLAKFTFLVSFLLFLGNLETKIVLLVFVVSSFLLEFSVRDAASDDVNELEKTILIVLASIIIILPFGQWVVKKLNPLPLPSHNQGESSNRDSGKPKKPVTPALTKK